jgi:hypothetical protein
LWQGLKEYVYQQYPAAIEEWKCFSEKYGWGFRLKDKKRAIIYLGPRENYFKASLVFGQKAFEQVMSSSVSQEVKDNLSSAKKYAEGRGVSVEVRNKKIVSDIKLLIDIKLKS